MHVSKNFIYLAARASKREADTITHLTPLTLICARSSFNIIRRAIADSTMSTPVRTRVRKMLYKAQVQVRFRDSRLNQRQNAPHHRHLPRPHIHHFGIGWAMPKITRTELHLRTDIIVIKRYWGQIRLRELIHR